MGSDVQLVAQMYSVIHLNLYFTLQLAKYK